MSSPFNKLLSKSLVPGPSSPSTPSITTPDFSGPRRLRVPAVRMSVNPTMTGLPVPVECGTPGAEVEGVDTTVGWLWHQL